MFIIANINPNYTKQSFTLGIERKNQKFRKKTHGIKKRVKEDSTGYLLNTYKTIILYYNSV